MKIVSCAHKIFTIMRSLLKIVFFAAFFSFLTSCRPDDSTSTIENREYSEVYEEDEVEIEEYLKSNYIEFDADNNATVTKIPEGGTQTSIWNQYSTDGGLTFPSIPVKNDARVSLATDGRVDDDVDYKLYYIKLNQGGGTTPTSVDSTLVAYKGWNMSNVVFDENQSGAWFSFPSTISAISGFRQILKEIRTEVSNIENPDGSVTRNDFGNIIVFIPSGLAYFAGSRTNIPAYSPIVFQIKLFSLKERDHDGDRVLSKYEDLNNDNDYFNDDTDGDKIPDFIDMDDDADGFLTKEEVKFTYLDGLITKTKYYPFNGAASDDLSTPYDDRRGIPRKFTGPINSGLPSPQESDFTDPARLRRHLDKTCKPPYQSN